MCIIYDAGRNSSYQLGKINIPLNLFSCLNSNEWLNSTSWKIHYTFFFHCLVVKISLLWKRHVKYSYMLLVEEFYVAGSG